MQRRAGERPLETPFQALWTVVLASHGAFAALWARAAPRGFPTDHPKFWSNEVFPVALLAAAAAGAVAALAGRRRPLLVAAAAIGPLWLAAAAAGRALFPVSLQALFLLPLSLGAAVSLAWLAVRRRARRFTWPWSALCALAGAAGAALGVALAVAQRAPLADTRPAAQSLPSIPLTPQPPPSVAVGPARIDLWRAAVGVPCGSRQLEIEPLLRFFTRSPDRFWARGPRQRPNLVPVALQRRGDGLEIKYSGTLERFLAAAPSGRGLTVEAFAALEEPLYSHLNAFATLRLRGAERPSIAFSPAPERPVEILEAEHPSGSPQRQAWLEPSGIFRVTQASDAEKGPFQTLAEGTLSRGDPLAVVLLDGGVPLCRVTFEDWAAQAGLAISPTAGWGAPVNAVEFSLSGGEALIQLTLAGTSVGRGTDTAGHAAGVYRNRVRVEPVP